MQELILLPEEESIGERADKYLAVQLPQYSRSFFQKLFKDDQIQIQNTPIKASYRITGEEEIALTIPDAQKPDIVPENIPLDILYEDQDLLVVNKPKGMVVHPAHGHYSGTLVNALMYHCKDSLSGINGVHAGYHVEHGGLARSVSPDDRHKIPVVQGQVNAV